MYKLQVLQFEEVKPSSEVVPRARSGHRMVADDNGDLYSFGGFNALRPKDESDLSTDPNWQRFKPLFQELWKFNRRTKKWKKINSTGDVPDKLVSHCMCYYDGKIIVYGGTGLPYGENSSNKLTIYHIDKNHWELIEPVSEPHRSPSEMYGQACVCDERNGELYIVGGTNGSQYSLDVHKFNFLTKRWTALYKSMDVQFEPGCRYRHEIALYNNKLYVFGGSTSNTFYGFEKLPTFDLETHQWSYTPTRGHQENGESEWPRARKCHSLSILGNDCYISGGLHDNSVCAGVWHINLEDLAWSPITRRIPYPVYFHAAAISKDARLTIFGGVQTTKGDIRNNKLTSIWLKIPSLKDICLLAIDYYADEQFVSRQRLCKTTGFLRLIWDDDL